MAQDPPAQDQMHYDAMAQEALRGVVKAALKRAAAPEGLPGAHHFYITFKTQAPGVDIPQRLIVRFPDEMTIVLQNRFWDLTVDAALAQGVPPRDIWRALCEDFDVPPERQLGRDQGRRPGAGGGAGGRAGGSVR